ncbi:Ku protein [Streptomyces decoyicus]|uniref:non-homologous end joining protein Ku n=1 Tax=Streptomyces decoyicus TaxID=249567 RepID=UPI0004ABA04A|nr:Ku protein [Streptomyces decoyicus]KOG41343.1 DNA repair protein [Streptomyces decoyicus]QZY20121.1 Ku protein [Streptomyces decoyicus]
MARPVWSGSLSFGLVSLPVQMYSATESHTVHFHQIERGTSDRIRNRRVNERTGEEVAAEDIVKGLDAGDTYVVVEPEELDDIAPGRSKALEISGFVDLDAVEPIFFDKTYYLGPRGKEYAKVYGLLHRALTMSRKAGIATLVLRNREYLVAVKAEADLLVLHTLHWADEIRDPYDEVANLPEKPKVTDRELKTAVELIEALSTDWEPEEYHDTYQEHVRRLIEAKQKGETVEKAAEPPESTNVVDLMDVLRSSVKRAQGKKSTGTRAKKATGTQKSRGTKKSEASNKPEASNKSRAPNKPRAPKKSSGGKQSARLDRLTKAELYERATEAGIRGRSSMSREELITALSPGGGRSRAKAS